MNPDNLFRQYRRMIWSLANSSAMHYNLEVTDLESLGDEIFVHCLRLYDPARAAFGTLLYRALSNEFKDEARRVNLRRERESQYTREVNLVSMPAVNSLARLADILIDLGEDAREVVRILFEETLQVRGREVRKNVRAAIRKFLAPHWELERIQLAFAELDGVLS